MKGETVGVIVGAICCEFFGEIIRWFRAAMEWYEKHVSFIGYSCESFCKIEFPRFIITIELQNVYR